MKYSKTMMIVRVVYDWIEFASWAGLTAFVIFFAIYMALHAPEIARRAEIIRIMNNEAEDRAYCEKWGLKRGTHAHSLCAMDLRQFRHDIERDFADQGSLL
jgi:hypothetical protein